MDKIAALKSCANDVCTEQDKLHKDIKSTQGSCNVIKGALESLISAAIKSAKSTDEESCVSDHERTIIPEGSANLSLESIDAILSEDDDDATDILDVSDSEEENLTCTAI